MKYVKFRQNGPEHIVIPVNSSNFKYGKILNCSVLGEYFICLVEFNNDDLVNVVYSSLEENFLEVSKEEYLAWKILDS